MLATGEAAVLVGQHRLQYLAGPDGAGSMLSARVPIVLNSRAVSLRSRLVSTVVMALLAGAQRRRQGPVV